MGGFRNAPKGKGISQAISRVKARAPILGGSFAIWGTLFSIFDCSIASLLKKEDPWNAIISGAAAGGVLALRGGIKAAGTNALAGGVILAAIEGLNIAVQRIIMPMFERSQQEQAALAGGAPIQVDLLDPPTDPLRRNSILQSASRPAGSTSRESNSILNGIFGRPNNDNNYGNGDEGSKLGESSMTKSSSSGSSGGFDLDSIDSFDTLGSGNSSMNGVAAADSQSTSTSSNSFFKW